ncbi:NAD(P)-dependent dehydrogenase (short-subunit alcohol dehydrogenase family) [Arcticibacter tournemirensis]|uniref:SDR family NAD(P)-dependent oxidoreductase n=1 Tax=Arcticibacter tournemirensis TaxID=699437 RepID=A0A5M9H9M8_9SPHI|nr:SDR family NAD(P)-dependent oxidoreductase [Arcticibacter tournemirensis]KAA8482925.1 SDR family NAD(P)-dependent oxidoreductase [Arcticibacter tournemirensis]TQM49690.1 NAD(P)-dependent dehydrogenase (short-subunit alcohol dehydrogenase family) [Arcticibacter tournemirensis]
MNRMYEKTVVITQASTEIGIAQTMLMAREGANIVACGHDRTILAKMSQEVNAKGGHFLYYTSRPGKVNWKEIFRFAKEEFGSVDTLINNPYLPKNKILLNASLFPSSNWRNSILTEYFEASKCFVREKRNELDGAIVNISINFPGKDTAMEMSHRIQSERLYRISSRILRRYRIRANHIIIDSQNTAQDINNKEIPGHAEDLAYLTLFFASDESYTLNGQSISIKMNQL